MRGAAATRSPCKKGELKLESYIIRIYRRDISDPDSVSGLVEGSTLKGALAFSSFREVLEILRESPAKAARSDKKRPDREIKAEGF